MTKDLEFTGERVVIGKSLPYLEEESKARYNFAKDFCNGKDVLDIGCGEGYGSNILSNTAKKVYGIDNSEEAIEYAKNTYGGKGIDFIRMDMPPINFKDRAFDTITLFEVIEHLPRAEKCIQEIKRILREGGVLILSTPLKKGETVNPFHIHEYSYEELHQLLKKYFKNVEIYGQISLEKKSLVHLILLKLDVFNFRRFFTRNMINKIEALVGSKPIDSVEENDFLISKEVFLNKKNGFFIGVCTL